MSNQITHETVNEFVYRLPKPLRDEFWSRRRAIIKKHADSRLGVTAYWKDVNSPACIAECMQLALELNASINQRINRWGSG